jgi:putative MFS transporter
MKDENRPAKFLWLPPGLRPHETMTWRQERVFLLVGSAMLFSGFDMTVFGLAIPQIQLSFAIPEDRAALTVSYFRLAAIVALLLCSMADFVGRRRLLLVTMAGQALGTLLTAFTQDYTQFVWAQIFTRIFGYAEEMLCVVVIVEEVGRTARGWANGTLSAMNYFGAGIASLLFAAITILPYGWRSLYVIGALSLALVAWLRRRLPETQRFTAGEAASDYAGRTRQSLQLLRRLATEYPGRLAAILTAVGAFGFATAAAYVLTSKYLQSEQHFTPGQVTMLIVPGGLIGLVLTITAGRLSDRLGRKRMAMAATAVAGLCFAAFYGGATGWMIPPLWVLGFAGYFTAEALMAGYALEIVPTAYRATVSGLRYLLEIGTGALALALEGVLFTALGSHGAAIQAMLLALPVTLIALLLLPEPAGRSLEEMTKR